MTRKAAELRVAGGPTTTKCESKRIKLDPCDRCECFDPEPIAYHHEDPHTRLCLGHHVFFDRNAIRERGLHVQDASNSSLQAGLLASASTIDDKGTRSRRGC